MWQESARSEDREFQLMEAYRAKLAQYLPIAGSCPVRERTDRRIKYFIVFASRQSDAIVLLNDIMVKAYFARMHEASYEGTLFEDTDWRDTRSIDGLDQAILDTIVRYPGEKREVIWFMIVEQHFMRYLHTEYRAAVQHLVDENTLISPTPRKTKRLNDDCILYLS